MQSNQNHLEQYFKYADALRNWLIVYGVGGIALLCSEKTPIDKKKIGGIIISLIIAVFLQVVIALINKWYNLFAHLGEKDSHIGLHPWYKAVILRYPYGNVWANAAADIISLGAFLYATYLLLRAIT